MKIHSQFYIHFSIEIKYIQLYGIHQFINMLKIQQNLKYDEYKVIGATKHVTLAFFYGIFITMITKS
jgi:hypothetical protein